MGNRCIITTAFGDRCENVQRLIKNIRQYVDYSIYIITSEDSYLGWLFIDLDEVNNLAEQGIFIKFVEQLWPNRHRTGQINSDYYQMKSALDSKYDEVLYLDDDMLIVDKDFVQGFELANKFGICLPLNPRSFVGVDAAIGSGVPECERNNVSIPLATAYNCGTIFMNTHLKKVRRFLSTYCGMFLQNPIRGPLSIWKTIELTSIIPYLLPAQWCVCQEDIGCANPIILHAGHEKVRHYYIKDLLTGKLPAFDK